MFNNREQAIIIWFVLLVLYAFYKQFKCDYSTRSFSDVIIDLIKPIFYSKLTYVWIIVVIYALSLTFLANWLVFWDNSQIKTLVVWVFSYAFVILSSVISNAKQRNWSGGIWDSFKLSAIVVFIVELYPFPLIVEMLIVPVVFVIIVITSNQNTDSYNGSKALHKIANSILNLLALATIFYVVYRIGYDINVLYEKHELISSINNNLIGYFLPIYYSAGYIPLLYIFALYCEYERANSEISRYNFSSNNKRKLLLLLIVFCNVRLNRIYIFRKFIIPCDFYNGASSNYRSLTSKAKQIEDINYCASKNSNMNGWHVASAKKFLTNEELHVDYYHPIGGSEWWADSKYSDKDIFFRLFGNSEEVLLLRLSCNICTVIDESSKLVDYFLCMETLIREATGIELSEELRFSFENEITYLNVMDNFAIMLTVDKYEKCKDYKFEIAPIHYKLMIHSDSISS